jgi:hypothetical protein
MHDGHSSPSCGTGRIAAPTPGAGAVAQSVPLQTRLMLARPNPTSHGATLAFELARGQHVRLSIYDVTGRLVNRVVNGRMEPGRHSAPWNGRDQQGAKVAPGVYFYRMQSEDVTTSRKLTVLR